MFEYKSNISFIKLHLVDKGDVIWIRVDRIEAVVYNPTNGGSYINMIDSDESYAVKETVDEVMRAISGDA